MFLQQDEYLSLLKFLPEFKDFQEGKIWFWPTHKLIVGTN